MNEIQIIQKQLAAERLHFAQVANATAAALRSGAFTASADFAAACADYFAFAVTRFGGDTASRLEAARASRGDVAADADARWGEFLRAFSEDSRKYFAAVDNLLARNTLVTEWRAVARIDADSIFAERKHYSRVTSTLPPGVVLEPSSRLP